MNQALNGGILTASHEYYSLGLGARGYIPLFEADLGGVTTLMFRHSMGYLGVFHSADEVPFYDRLWWRSIPGASWF